MPKRLRYTQLLGLNARGLTRHQKKQIVWKKHVKGKFNRSQYVKPTPQKIVNTMNPFWDKYHDQQQKFNTMGLKAFLQNPSKIFTILPKQRKIIYRKLKHAQLTIEYLKYKYSVAIPDKHSLKIISTLAQGQGIVQLKTSNHCNGYWAHLLSQKNPKCKVYNVYKTLKNQKLKTKKNKHKNKNVPKSKQILAAEAKEWIEIGNKDCSAEINDILQHCSHFVLLMIYPDFKLDFSVINEVVQNKKDKNENDESYGYKYRSFGRLMDGENEGFLSVECLKCFKGNYVVHIGELFGCTYDGNNVWGRTSSMEFQIELQREFHKVYQYEMCRWPMFRDTLTIWKRNKVENVGSEQIVCLQDGEMNDGMNTKYWESVFKQRIGGKKSGKRNIFEGANYAAGK